MNRLARDISGRRLLAFLAALAATFALLVALRWNETPVGSLTDDAHYLEMARSLAEGRGPLILTGADPTAEEPDTFPPGFPLLLAPLVHAMPGAVNVGKTVPLVATLVLGVMCWLFPARGTSRKQRLALTALVLLNPWIVAWSVRIMSDLPYTALSLAAILLHLRGRRADDGGAATGLLLGLLAGLAALVRTIGILLPGLVLADLLWGRRWKHAGGMALGTGLVLAIPWLAGWSHDLISGAYHAQVLDHHSDLPARLAFAWDATRGYLSELPTALVPVFGNPTHALAAKLGLSGAATLLQAALGAALLAVMGTGLATTLGHEDPERRARAGFCGLYLAGYAAVLLNFDGYPSGVQTRLLLPVLPLLLWYLLQGGAALVRIFGLRRTPVAVFAVALLLTASLIHNAWRVARPLRSTREATGHGLVDPSVGTAWLRRQARPSDVVLAQAPLERHVHLTLPVVACGDSLTDAALRRRCDQLGVAWVFVGPVVHGPPRRLDATGQRLHRVMQQSAWARPVFADSAQAVWVYRAGGR